MLDRFIIEFDKALRTLLAEPHSVRPHPGKRHEDVALEDRERRHAAALMRVNHCGEVCAQALYNGQSLTARDETTAAALRQAAQEETEHLAWCEGRIHELGGRTSVLNPIWYGGSFALGTLAGALGKRWNMGFLAETERQVGWHLVEHMAKLPEHDAKSRAILAQMQTDEAAHADNAVRHGAAELPKPVKSAMRHLSKLMTRTSYYL
ncbi:MAG TPA: 2-polyprenyl-3-methyl-6-methoxy-1,4-benzoquinone monooxygenase [Methylophilaceae bacterium]|nr:2-polyprenyl-3-methyl-6-methoxy-1,4-benzoquinone monooxygenase [Methylophilaceae bacterium]